MPGRAIWRCTSRRTASSGPGCFLRDVSYRLHAELLPVGDDARANPAKYREMFQRRAEKGQCVNQPYLGCREFAARFRLVTDPDSEAPAPG